MNAEIRVFNSFAEEQAADPQYWARLTPDQRVEALEDIRQNAWKITGERLQGLRRVIQVLERAGS